MFFSYLSDITGDPVYAQKVERVREVRKNNLIHFVTGQSEETILTLKRHQIEMGKYFGIKQNSCALLRATKPLISVDHSICGTNPNLVTHSFGLLI